MATSTPPNGLSKSWHMKTSLLAGTWKLPIVIVTVLGSLVEASTEPADPVPVVPLPLPPVPLTEAPLAPASSLADTFPGPLFPPLTDPPLDDDAPALLAPVPAVL